MSTSIKKIPAFIPSRAKLSNSIEYQYITKKIFKTWRTSEVSQEMYNAVYTWIDKNPDWEFHFFDDEACRGFLKENFEKNVLEAYDNIIPGAYKCDLWRYCVLYIHGGVYSDIKQELLVSLDDVLSNDIEFASVKDKYKSDYEFDGYIYQAFMCSKPKHPFLKKAIDMIVENSKNGFYGNDPLSITGPGLLGKAINLTVNQQEKTPLHSGANNINNFRFELFPYIKDAIYTHQNAMFIKPEYNRSYKNDLHVNLKKNFAGNYSLCWFTGKCFASGKIDRIKSKFFNKRKGRYIIDSLYLEGKLNKARLTGIKYILLQPTRSLFLIRKIIKNEKQFKN